MKEKLKIKFEIVERTKDKVEKILKFDIADAFSESSTLIDFVLFEIVMTF